MEIANEIRRLYAIGNVTMQELAEQFGFQSRQAIYAIVREKSWKGN
jgi:predicted DNA-binding protein YlxM (UPF0122 family)